MDSLLVTTMGIFICNSSLISYVQCFLIQGDDTKNSYQALIKVMNEVDFYKHGIKLTYQFSPLSWHFNSYKINQGIFYIDKKAFFFVL